MPNTYHAFDVISPFHAISSLSYCLYQSSANDSITLHIVPAMHGQYLLKECSFMTLSGVHVELVHQTKRSIGLGVFGSLLRRWMPKGSQNSENSVFLGHHTYFKPTVLKYLSKSTAPHIKTFAFEEGIGSYHTLTQEREVSLREGKRFYMVKFFLKRLLATKLFLDQRWGLLNSADNENVRYWHTLAVTELARNLYAEEGESSVPDGVLFFTSPLVCLGLLNNQENEELIIKIRTFLKHRGKMLYIKPHPLDQQVYEHLVEPGCVVNTQAPAEVHLIQHRYAAVAGVNSGALLTASMMFNVRAINFCSWLPRLAQQKLLLGPNLQTLFTQYTCDCEELYDDSW
ncbi:polysialyltransferase family glycosyltransferase [Halomonas sp. M1]|uniref:polysialyltransferase family glycosyltransferase n=1 Tax=Halomonas sp. M1 TaxID=3035470 RepID=UPI002486859E|nr:polysialyltransferase family glycosyltransferase [Halomonas sp. M1]WFE72461.1 polysialyltransferase family glycosyltransferase [Halomonas sp. M1]